MSLETPAFEREIQDDQLRMMFSCCHPELSTEAQVTLILKTLCGFGVSEIAHALLTTEESIEKRLGRARKLSRASGTFTEISHALKVRERLEPVYQAIYLLFNEGYHSSRSERVVLEDLCFEAIRLALLLSEHREAGEPKTHALVALLCFHAARLPGRIDDEGDLLQLEMQDRSKWDQELISRGFSYLSKASTGTELSEYHLQAGIAALHCAASSYQQTEWTKILELYDILYRLKPSPVRGLESSCRLRQSSWAGRGIDGTMQYSRLGRAKRYPFYPAALAEFHLLAGRTVEASRHFERALKLARSGSERNFFESKLKACARGAA